MFKVFNRQEEYIKNLNDVITAKHSEEINGEDILELETLDTIEKGYRLVYRNILGYWKEFAVTGIEEERANEGIIRKVYAESSFYETIGDYVDDKRPNNVAVNIALLNALEPTRWQVGQVDNLGINSISLYHLSAKEAVQIISKTWQGEIRARVEVVGSKITNRYVDLFKHRGSDLGKRFTYTKDLESIKKEVQRDDVITALYGYGKGEEVGEGHGRRLDFKDINFGRGYATDGYTWEELEETYNDWTEFEEKYLNWQYIESKGLATWGRPNGDGTKSHVFGKVDFDDIEDKEELYNATMERLLEISEPLITYEAKVIDLKALGLEHEGVDLGDTVAVIDKEFKPELRLKARVIKITRDLLNPENNEILLGNFIDDITDSLNKTERFIDNFRGRAGVWDRATFLDENGVMADIIDQLNTKLNATGGYVYFRENKGIEILNKAEDQNPTQAIFLGGGYFRIANEKLPNGEWNYRTFGTGDGFVADMIIAGILKGGNVEFDLTNGTLLIGNSISDYQLLFDGSRLSIGNFGIDAGVLEFTTEEYYRDYTLADMSFARWMHIKGITPTQEDLLIYDLNNDGVIDGFDIMIIKRHCLGIKSLKRRVI